ncbi:MAG: CHAT domain protein [Syntrophorhabdus sp. PtaB.Bin006]|nr:MAG: CHAT domain protein [Syntrophorhabdus sp. PtaB.Bin006]
MTTKKEAERFYKELNNHRDELQDLLGPLWPEFADLLSRLEQSLAHSDGSQAEWLMDQIIEIGLDSPAAAFMRRILSHVLGYRSAKPPVKHEEDSNPEAGAPVEKEELLAKASREYKEYADAPTRGAETPVVKKMEAESATKPSPPEPRYFNTFFSDETGEGALNDREPLIQGRSYRLCVEVNTEQRGLGKDISPFPDGALKEAWYDQETISLTVTISSHDFDLTLTDRVLYLDLPRTGNSPVVEFRVSPRLSEGRGVIQVDVFYRGYKLQSKLVEAYIVAAPNVTLPADLEKAQTARVTFTTTEHLDLEDLKSLPARVLTVDVSRDQRDNSIDFRFFDRTRGAKDIIACYDTRLQPQALETALEGVRLQLKTMVTGGVSSGTGTMDYQWIVKGDDARLQYWLPQLARAGRYLYRALLPENQTQVEDRDRGERLRAVLEPDTVIQVNPVLGVVTIPWALLYEREIMPGPTTRVCEHYKEHGPAGHDCPERNDPTVVCPYAFWGYRYAIEQLPCWTDDEERGLPPLVRAISNSRPLQISLNVWKNFRYWRNHMTRIEDSGDVVVLVAEEIGQLQEVWKAHGTELDIVYFYCHGGRDEIMKQPYLELSDGRIESLSMESLAPKWPHNPLVLLNGCATGDYGPESYVSLISDFRDAGASGVVGTECPVPELFAEAYAASLLPRVFRGQPVGPAMLDTRRQFLLEEKNPLGLVYTLYAAQEITLATPVAKP